MTLEIAALASVVFIFWGSSGFFDKLATNSLGSKGAWIWALTYLPSLICLFTGFLFAEKFGWPKQGMGFLLLTNIVSTVAVISYYLLMSKANASLIVPLTSLYPVVTVVLAIFVLKESITITKILGILFSMIAILFLSL